MGMEELDRSWSNTAGKFDRMNGDSVAVLDGMEDRWQKEEQVPDSRILQNDSVGRCGRDETIRFTATPLQMRMGRYASYLAVFFVKHHKIPFFFTIGMYWARRAFWFASGDIPVISKGDPSDSKYLTSRSFKGS